MLDFVRSWLPLDPFPIKNNRLVKETLLLLNSLGSSNRKKVEKTSRTSRKNYVFSKQSRNYDVCVVKTTGIATTSEIPFLQILFLSTQNDIIFEFM